jgi:hypothetical protein
VVPLARNRSPLEIVAGGVLVHGRGVDRKTGGFPQELVSNGNRPSLAMLQLVTTRVVNPHRDDLHKGGWQPAAARSPAAAGSVAARSVARSSDLKSEVNT